MSAEARMDEILKDTNEVHPQLLLKGLKPAKPFFIGIDSDGCVFDTMVIKQMECFCPSLIKNFELQLIADYVRETWEFVSLYSKNRGANRFIALVETIKLLGDRPEVRAFKDVLPDLTPVVEWINNETRLGNPALKKYASETANPIIDKALCWSLESNEMMVKSVGGVSPFDNVIQALEKIHEKADAVVVSQCAGEVLEFEWDNHEMGGLVYGIAGQEYGSKTEQLAIAAVGKYPAKQILMIGDAPGDKKAAENNGVLFFPIIPGQEVGSWKRFDEEGLDRFLQGRFAGAYQRALIEEYDDHLADVPPWSK